MFVAIPMSISYTLQISQDHIATPPGELLKRKQKSRKVRTNLESRQYHSG